MSTDPIRFLLVAENFCDRSLFSILRAEGHEVGWLVSDFANQANHHPLPKDTPVMTTPAMAEQFNPAVILFPQPFAGALGSEFLKQKRWVIGSSNFHHKVSELDPAYSKVLLKNAGLPAFPTHYVSEEGEFQHLLNLLEAHYHEDKQIYLLSYGPYENFFRSTLEGLKRAATFLDQTRFLRVTALPREAGYKMTTLCMLFAGTHRMPTVFSVGSGYTGATPAGKIHVACALTEVDSPDPAARAVLGLTKEFVALRYVGPVFVTYISDEDDELVGVVGLTSVCPSGFWSALWGSSKFDRGFGKGLLHWARHTLKDFPTRAVESTTRCNHNYWLATRVCLHPWPHPVSPSNFRGGGYPFEPQLGVQGVLISEDIIDNRICGPQLGWFVGDAQTTQGFSQNPEGYPTIQSFPSVAFDNEQYAYHTRIKFLDDPVPLEIPTGTGYSVGEHPPHPSSLTEENSDGDNAQPPRDLSSEQRPNHEGDRLLDVGVQLGQLPTDEHQPNGSSVQRQERSDPGSLGDREGHHVERVDLDPPETDPVGV